MYSDENVLEVRNVSKSYEMYALPSDRFWQMVFGKKRKYYKEVKVLSNIDFSLKKGECIGIIGRNGAGKSTLLQMITGTLQPTEGSIETKGKIAALLELGSGFNPEFTGKENVYMNAALLGFSRDEIEQRYQEIVDFADIGEYIDQPVKKYSSGMMVRLAFAVQVVVEPDLLIVDEALSVGDVAFQFKCLNRIREIVSKGTSVLLVSHDTSTVKTFCNKCIWLKKGNVFRYGDAGEVADAYELEARLEVEASQKIKKQPDQGKKEYGITKVGESKLAWEEDTDIEHTKAIRYGTGETRVKKVVLLDKAGCCITNVDFGQEVILRIYFEVYKRQDFLSVYYLINDSNHVPLLGYGSYMSNNGVCYSLEPGRYVIDFNTTFPLTAGQYGITIALTTPTEHDRASVSHDRIENIVLFFMEPRKPDRIWSYVQVDNSIVLEKIN